MLSPTIRIERFLMWLLLIVFVVAALSITGLRVVLPKLNQYQVEIQTWISERTGFEVTIDSVQGRWRNTNPSLNLSGLKVSAPGADTVLFDIDNIEIQVNILSSLLIGKPQLADLRLSGVKADLTQLPGSSEEQNAESGHSLFDNIEQVFLVQLAHFSLSDSQVTFTALNGESRVLDIASLKWKNADRTHLVEATLSIANSELNQLKVIANFTENGSIETLNGDFYLQADDIQVTPWLNQYLQDETGITTGDLSVEAWGRLKNGQPIDALVQLSPSQIRWIDDKEKHTLTIHNGLLQLFPKDNGWEVYASTLSIDTDDKQWPELSAAFSWSNNQWLLNISELSLNTIKPIIALIPESTSIDNWIKKIGPEGQVGDIRIAKKEKGQPYFSASVTQFGVQQWALLPEIHKLEVQLAGNAVKGEAKIKLLDDTLPYGDVFQAPLNIKYAEVMTYWMINDDGWQLWSDRIDVTTPDLQAIGEFRLDVPYETSALLSFYGEIDVYNAGETWRYLPTLVLGQSLTDYFSTAIQGGKAKTAQLLWYGELGDFPYTNNDGIFQVEVPLREAKFSFDTAWPTIENLQLDLTFKNASMFFDSRSARLMDVQATRVIGKVADLGEDGHLMITANAKSSGESVRNYMSASPLVDSVGAALTTFQVEGDITTEFQLDIPFDGSMVRSWGYADLNNNHVEIPSLLIDLSSVSGRINFNDDVINGQGLKAQFLNQPIDVDFNGENQPKGYAVDINASGRWQVDPLKPYIDHQAMARVNGQFDWKTSIDVQMEDIGFTYQIDLLANIADIESFLPYPLNKSLSDKGKVKVQTSGNKQALSARVILPQAKYQAEINISAQKPVIEASNVVIGKGSFKVSPVVGHYASMNAVKFDMDAWLDLFPIFSNATSIANDTISKLPIIPMPEKVTLNVDELTLASLDWHNVKSEARKKSLGWYVDLNSREAKGELRYRDGDPLVVQLESMHLYIPALDMEGEDKIHHAKIEQPLISKLDSQLHQYIPNLDFSVKDAWLQGYKLGQINLQLRREEDKLVWQEFSVTSGANLFNLQGQWTLNEQDNISHSDFSLTMKGENNSELLERFGISSGIQKAPFSVTANLDWDGALWSMRVNTLDGDVKTKFGNGTITDVKGAARLLGLFSLDSIIRKMKLDFTDVFDEGMVFNSITGSGKMKGGVFVSNNLTMDAVAGEMIIKGKADMNTRLVDAEVKFTPDLTSGIPIITAFAVTPVTALYVLAVTTALSPVIDVITQVQYEVKGPLDSPTVKELSRSKGEYTLSEVELNTDK